MLGKKKKKKQELSEEQEDFEDDVEPDDEYYDDEEIEDVPKKKSKKRTSKSDDIWSLQEIPIQTKKVVHNSETDEYFDLDDVFPTILNNQETIFDTLKRSGL